MVHPHHIHGPAPASALDPRLTEDHWHHLLHTPDLAQRLGVLDVQLVGGATEGAGNPHRLHLAGVDGDKTGAKLGELADNELARALPERGQHDHCRNTDRDTQTGQESAQPVASQSRHHEAQEIHTHLRLKAVTGSRRVARRAGHTPKPTPTATDRVIAAASAHHGGNAGNDG